MVDRSSDSGLRPSGFTSQVQCSPALRLLGKLLDPWEPLWRSQQDLPDRVIVGIMRALSTGLVHVAAACLCAL